MNKRSLPVYKSLTAAFIELFYKHERGESNFPEKLGKYTFVEELFPPIRPNPYYHYGLYKDKKNNMFFVKQWIGKNKSWSLGAIMLYQEIQTNLLFKKLTKNTTCKILPIKAIYEDTTQITVMYPFVKITDFTKATTNEKYTAYHNAFVFLSHLSEKSYDTSILSSRKSYMYALQYILFFIRSFYLHPEERKTLLKGMYHFLKGYKYMSKSKLSIAHRDLHLGNILRVHGDQYIADFALTTRTIEHYDLIRSYLYNLQDKALTKRIVGDINNLILCKKVSKRYVESLSIFMLTHLLSVPILSKEIHGRFKDCLKAVINDEVFITLPSTKKISVSKKLITILADRLLLQKNEQIHKKPFFTIRQQNSMTKTWSGSQRSMHYFDLLQEITLYSLFKKYNTRISRKNTGVSFPTLQRIEIANTQILLKTKYIATEKSYHSFTQQFILITDFLSKFTLVLSQKDIKLIGVKGIVRFILLSPLTLVKAIYRFPSHTGLFVSSYFLALLTSPWIYKTNKQSIVHGDLHPENILNNNGKIYLIDFEQTHITSHLFEVATSITSTKLSSRDQTEFRSFVNQSFTISEKIAIASLCYFNLLETIAHVHEEKKVQLYVERIKFAHDLLFSTFPQISFVKGGLI